MEAPKKPNIKAIIGLGNPGDKYYYHRHNIGFRVLDALVKSYNTQWSSKDLLESAQIQQDGRITTLIKPMTFMNSSGKALPFLLRKGITAEQILVVHDELELPFGTVKLRFNGSAKGHNGLKSIMEVIGKDFWRLSCGIGRPDCKEEVPQYVLSSFIESLQAMNEYIQKAVQSINNIFASSNN
jgi:PTH1 family peptidyl-tRNA hydrolase